MSQEKLTIELAFQEGVEVKIVNGRVILSIDAEVTKRDLWINQTEIWLEDENGVIDSGYLRVTNKKKLLFSKGTK